jgi:acetyltransferase-like isoleucine patch superfamily enzyme
MKNIFSLVVAVIPFNFFRVCLYKLFPGYKIDFGAKIGFLTIINVRQCTIKKAKVGMFCQFTGRFSLDIGYGANIGHQNRIYSSGKGITGYCKIAPQAHITNGHLIDATGGFMLGAFSRIAGYGSQFWTHGGQREKSEIIIGEKCYIGSAVRVAQGVTIADNTYVGLGSVVVHNSDEQGVLLAGHPAKVVKQGITARKSLSNNHFSDSVHAKK